MGNLEGTDTVQAHGNMIKKAKVHLELDPFRDQRRQQERLLYVHRRQKEGKARENVGPLLKETGPGYTGRGRG